MAAHDDLHVILGAGGAAGTPLALELLAAGRRVRTVSRSGRGLAAAEALAADLTVREQVAGAVGQGSTVYLLAGLAYDRRVWRVQWPAIMDNVIEACRATGSRLLFLDNVYLYGRVRGPMTEDTPVRPSSVKGEIRARIADRLMTEAASGRLRALIARAADFYGPFSERSSMPYILVMSRLASGRPALVLGKADTLHSYTCTTDVGKALARLAEADDVWGQVWHLPTASPPPTGRQFVELAARELGVAPRLSVVPGWALHAAGLFDTTMRELAEMLYQNKSDYVFDSSKIQQRLGLAPTPYHKGIRDTVEAMRSASPAGSVSK